MAFNILTIIKNLFSSNDSHADLALHVAQLTAEAKGLRKALGVLTRNHDAEMQKKDLLLGCLLSAYGGSVTISNDLVNAVSKTTFLVNYEVDKETQSLTVSIHTPQPQPQPQPKAEAEPEFEDDTKNGD